MDTVLVVEERMMAVENRFHQHILDALRTNRRQTLDRLSHVWPAAGWAQLLLAVDDRLSRTGQIIIWSCRSLVAT